MGFKSDYTSNLYSLYRERAKLFRQTLLGLNLFATAFFLFIVVPYYSAMSGSVTLSNRIRTLNDEIPKLEKPVTLLSQALEGTAKLETDMQHATRELREYVTGLVLNEPGRIIKLIGSEVPSVAFLECMAAYNGVIPIEGSLTAGRPVDRTDDTEGLTRCLSKFPGNFEPGFPRSQRRHHATADASALGLLLPR